MRNIELSIIIPVYNIENYLSNCIDSILCQEYKSKYEIILIDDGSTDESGKICDNYAKNYGFIQVIHKKNEGVSKARNIGLDIAKGQYIMFVDGDDELEKNVLNVMMAIISKNKADIVECDYNELYNTKKISKGANDYKEIEYNNNNDIMRNFLNKKISIGIWNKIFSQKVIDRVRFDENINHYEDKLFIFDVLKNSKNLVHININGYNYRKRTGSASNDKFKYSYLEIEEVDDILVEHIKRYYNDLYIYAEKNRLETYLILIKMITVAKKYNEYKEEYNNLRRKVSKIDRNVIKLLNLKRRMEVFLIKYMKRFYIMIYTVYEILKEKLRGKK